jgi:methionyl-tRNA synthetase
MDKKSFYITTTLPYVNSDPHIGFAMEIIRADTVARWKKLNGFEVFFNTGTDEHGQKIWQKSVEAGVDTQKYVDEYAEKFKNLIPLLDISPDAHFVRTTDEHHIKSAQEFWKLCDKNGDIYKKNYSVKYCVGCELEKTDSEIENGHCTIHPNLELEVREEENYFFKFSNYGQKLLDFYKSNPCFVIPESRFNEIKSFVSSGLQDFSISRLKEKMSWGVPVPGDDNHVMYVWFDALVSYISALDWPENTANFEKFWINGTPTQYAGKDNLRQQSAMWQAMLMSAHIPNSHQIVINGFINSGGQKMSKSLGNVINPKEIVNEYGADAFRYYVLREFNSFEDSDFTMEKFKEAYNANLRKFSLKSYENV